MSTHDWFVANRTAFVIRALEADEEKTFREHLAGCAECREDVERLERELAWLPMASAPMAPRPDLTRRFVSGALGAPRGAGRWLVPAALAASVLLAATTVFGLARWRQANDQAARLGLQLNQVERELGLVRDTLGILRGASRVAQASFMVDRSPGGLIIFDDERSHRWNVVIYGLPPAPPNQVCQFWFITDSGMVRSAEVRMEAKGPAILTLGMPASGGKVMGAALTIEPMGNNGSTPRGRQVAHLMLD